MNRIEKRNIYIDYLETLNESSSREKKIEKAKKKIKKFLKNDIFIDFLIKKVVSEDSSKGVKYLVWFADKVLDNMKVNQGEIYQKNLTKYIKTGDFSLEEMNDYFQEVNKTLNWLTVKEKFDSNVRYVLEFDLDDDISMIVDWLKSPLREDEETDLSEYKTLKDAYDVAQEWHDELKASGNIDEEHGNIIMEFDDGYYWIDLQTTEDKEEAEAMGHCGTTTEGTTLLSLRKNKSPHVTMSIDNENDFVVTQCKGRNNKKPVEKYHKYIVDLLMSDSFAAIEEFRLEYDTGDDFDVDDLSPELYKKLISDNPGWLRLFDVSKFLSVFENDFEIYENMSLLNILKILIEISEDRDFDKLLEWFKINKPIDFGIGSIKIKQKGDNLYFEKPIESGFLNIDFITFKKTSNYSFDNSNFVLNVIEWISNLRFTFDFLDDVDIIEQCLMSGFNMSNALTRVTYDKYADFFKDNKVKKLAEKYDEEIHLPKLQEEQKKYCKFLEKFGIFDIKNENEKITWSVNTKDFFEKVQEQYKEEKQNFFTPYHDIDDIFYLWKSNIYFSTTHDKIKYILGYDMIEEFNHFLNDKFSEALNSTKSPKN